MNGLGADLAELAVLKGRIAERGLRRVGLPAGQL